MQTDLAPDRACLTRFDLAALDTARAQRAATDETDYSVHDVPLDRVRRDHRAFIELTGRWPLPVRALGTLLVSTALLASPAAAQESLDTRSGAALQARTDKAAAPAAISSDTVERWLDAIERRALQFSASRDGWGVRFGGITDGSGMAVGPMWQTTRLLGGRLHVQASAAASIARDREIESGLTVPEVGTSRVALRVTASSGHLAQERFFGTGQASRRSDETVFALDRRRARADATLQVARWLHVSAGASSLTFTSAAGQAAGAPSITTVFDERAAPGLSTRRRFGLFALSATADTRDVPGNPRRGGRYHLGLERYADAAKESSFTRVNAELEHHLSWWRRQRLVTLRAVAVLSEADRGQRVPFYLQPTLGGTRLLRGFVTDRFRDLNVLALQAEYAWDIWPFLNAVAFYETGAVAPRWQELALNTFRRDYGVGVRLGSARTVALRTDVAMGSGEGTRLVMRLSHAF